MKSWLKVIFSNNGLLGKNKCFTVQQNAPMPGVGQHCPKASEYWRQKSPKYDILETI